MDTRDYIKLSDIAKEFNIDRSTVYKWVEKGYLKTTRLPTGTHRVDRKDYELFLNSKKSNNPIKVLVVDDQIEVLDAIKAQLETIKSLSLNVEISTDGFSALLNIGDYKPDVVIMDYRLGGSDGLVLAERIFSNSKFTNVQIIIISGFLEEIDMSVVHGNIQSFLRKPVTCQELEQALLKCVPFKVPSW
jgi:CheY-like chemotaxis protein